MVLQSLSTGFFAAIAVVYIIYANSSFYTGYFLTGDGSQETFVVLERFTPDAATKHYLFSCLQRGKPLESNYENTNQSRFHVGVTYLCSAVNARDAPVSSDYYTTTLKLSKGKKDISESDAKPEIAMKTTQDNKDIQRKITDALENMYLQVNIPWHA